jgi:UDP-3-O-[3-hydroxymyristoyl] glucosamine N-acyltransferase
MKLSNIANLLGEKYHGQDIDIERVGSLDADLINAILYIESAKYLEKALLKHPGALLVPKGLNKVEIPYIEVEDPKLAFIKVLEIFNPDLTKPDKPYVDECARVSNKARLNSGVTIMAGTVIMEGVTVEAGSIIYPNCVLENNCAIGAGTKLFSGVIIRERCIIGNGCIIHPGTVIGSDGFGYHKKGKNIIKIPQIGTVKIGDRVEIGANCTIDRATVDITEIGSDSKFDNLVHIAHNVKIGERCLIAAQTVIGGSATIGSDVIISGQVAVADHVFITNNTVIMGQSAIHNDIKKSDVFIGTPARSVKEHHKIFAALKYLPDLLKRVKNLENILKADENKIVK